MKLPENSIISSEKLKNYLLALTPETINQSFLKGWVLPPIIGKSLKLEFEKLFSTMKLN